MAKTAYLEQKGRTSAPASRSKTSAASPRFDNRRRLMQAALAACKRLQMDDDDRKSVQLRITGVASMADMSVAQLGQFLDHLNDGWKGPMAHRSHIGKIRALWWSLYWLGGIDGPDDHALSAFVQRQTGLSQLKFVDHKNAPAIIEALKSWLTRLNVKWPESKRGRASDAVVIAERQAVLTAIIGHIDATGYLAFDGHQTLPETAHELDAAIRTAGKTLRELQAALSGDHEDAVNDSLRVIADLEAKFPPDQTYAHEQVIAALAEIKVELTL